MFTETDMEDAMLIALMGSIFGCSSPTPELDVRTQCVDAFCTEVALTASVQGVEVAEEDLQWSIGTAALGAGFSLNLLPTEATPNIRLQLVDNEDVHAEAFVQLTPLPKPAVEEDVVAPPLFWATGWSLTGGQTYDPVADRCILRIGKMSGCFWAGGSQEFSWDWTPDGVSSGMEMAHIDGDVTPTLHSAVNLVELEVGTDGSVQFLVDMVLDGGASGTLDAHSTNDGDLTTTRHAVYCDDDPQGSGLQITPE